jgi:ubiquinone/menaquinone biosynthesis C-methylase UbiE
MTDAVPPPSRGARTTGHRHGSHGWEGLGREEALARLESPDRRRWQDPERLWKEVGLLPGETVVDVGAGTGYFALPAARLVGPKGRVYAVDVARDLHALVGERGASEKLEWLVPVLSESGRIPLESSIADVVLFANVLHDVPEETIAEAVRLLRPKGRLVNLDWRKTETPFGPPSEIRLSPEEARERLSFHGLRPLRPIEAGPYHYAELFARA